MVVRSIGVWSAARLYGAISAAIGLILGCILALASMLGATMGGSEEGPAWVMGALGMGAIIIMPIFYGLMGIVGGAIGALLYNLFASVVGGVEVDVS
jgi:hypothetical protein